MNDISASLAVGCILVLIGGSLFAWHVRSWRAARTDPSLNDREIRHYRAEFRRRAFVSILMILLGIMIPVGDALMVQRRNAGFLAVYWMVVLLIAFGLMFVAALDWLSGRMHERATRGALAGLNRKRRELEAEVERLRNEHRNGGR